MRLRSCFVAQAFRFCLPVCPFLRGSSLVDAHSTLSESTVCHNAKEQAFVSQAGARMAGYDKLSALLTSMRDRHHIAMASPAPPNTEVGSKQVGTAVPTPDPEPDSAPASPLPSQIEQLLDELLNLARTTRGHWVADIRYGDTGVATAHM